MGSHYIMNKMGLEDLTYDCKATIFADVVEYYDTLVEQQKSSGYDIDDPYCANITSFCGIKLLEGFAKNREEAEKEVIDKGEKWGPAITKFYYPEGFQEYSNKSEIKKRVNEITKLHTKLKNEHDQIAQYVKSTYEKIQSKETTKYMSCVSCKSKISKGYIHKCIGTTAYGDGFITYYNKCIVCNNDFIKSKEEKYNTLKEEYKNVSHVYAAVFGGMVAS